MSADDDPANQREEKTPPSTSARTESRLPCLCWRAYLTLPVSFLPEDRDAGTCPIGVLRGLVYYPPLVNFPLVWCVGYKLVLPQAS